MAFNPQNGFMKERTSNMIEGTIVKWGNSQGIRFSKDLLKAANIGINDTVEIFAEDGRIILVKRLRRRTLTELFADYTGDYKPVEISTGPSIGKEL